MNALRLPQLETKLGIKKTKIWQLIKAGELPAPRKMGRNSIWLEAEVDEAFAKLLERSRPIQRVG